MSEGHFASRNWHRPISLDLAVDAVGAAANTAGLPQWSIIAEWKDRKAQYDDVERARRRIRCDQPPESYLVSAQAPGRGGGSPLAVWVYASSDLDLTRVSAEGGDPDRLGPTLEAAVSVIERALPASASGLLTRAASTPVSARLALAVGAVLTAVGVLATALAQ